MGRGGVLNDPSKLRFYTFCTYVHFSYIESEYLGVAFKFEVVSYLGKYSIKRSTLLG